MDVASFRSVIRICVIKPAMGLVLIARRTTALSAKIVVCGFTSINMFSTFFSLCYLKWKRVQLLSNEPENNDELPGHGSAECLVCGEEFIKIVFH
jgi:hypothetical protein